MKKTMAKKTTPKRLTKKKSTKALPKKTMKHSIKRKMRKIIVKKTRLARTPIRKVTKTTRKSRPSLPSLPSSVGKKHVLVIDDEADIRISVKTALESGGYEVDCAQNGDEGLAMSAIHQYDLILLDIMMPGTPVRDIIPKITETPIAFLSVVRTSEAEKSALLGQKNIKVFIQKPFSITDLIQQVKKLIG